MNIKKYISVILYSIILLIFANTHYAGPSIDDIGLLTEPSPATSVKKAVDPLKAEKPLASAPSGQVASSMASQNNMPLIVGVGIAGVIFITILYFYYLRIKKLSDQAQVSRDLAEKYFYNIQEAQNEVEKIAKGMEARAAEIVQMADKEISLKAQGIARIVYDKVVNDILEFKENGSKTSNKGSSTGDGEKAKTTYNITIKDSQLGNKEINGGIKIAEDKELN